ncbi:MAG: acyl carrier protein phosphodiesterase [Flavobacteriales bacterium]
MNYLAHLVLGGCDPDLMLGNFIGDAVKGSPHRTLPKRVADGVMLHRWIDTTADEHELSGISRAELRPVLGRMSGVGLDLLHDYFLARHFDVFMPDWPGGLEGFARHVESQLSLRSAEMPERSGRFLEAMKRNDWLVGYGDRDRMLDVCRSMDDRISWDSHLGLLFDAVDAVDEVVLESRFLCLMHDLMAGRSQAWTAW